MNDDDNTSYVYFYAMFINNENIARLLRVIGYCAYKIVFTRCHCLWLLFKDTNTNVFNTTLIIKDRKKTSVTSNQTEWVLYDNIDTGLVECDSRDVAHLR